MFSIASQCACGGMHINSDLNIVQFEDLTPEAISSGSHDLVFTPLLAYGMPLLRYVNGDQGAPALGRCDCGRSLPRMKGCVGRTLDTLVLCDGTPIHGHLFLRRVHALAGIDRFQFRQSVPGTAELLVIKDRHFTEETARRLAGLEAEVERDLDIKISIPVRYVEDIPLTALGKHRYVVSTLAANRRRGNAEGEG